MATTNHLSTMLAILLGAAAGGWVLLEAHVLDLVEERGVADSQLLGGLHAVPAALLERVGDNVTLGLQHRAPRDFLEREPPGWCEGIGGGRGGGGRRRHQGARKVPVLQHDHALDEVL